jgi:hypothetical protein
MSQPSSGDFTTKKLSEMEENEIIENLEVLLNYDSLEQVDSWEVLIDMADLGSALEPESQDEEDGN